MALRGEQFSRTNDRPRIVKTQPHTELEDEAMFQNGTGGGPLQPANLAVLPDRILAHWLDIKRWFGFAAPAALGDSHLESYLNTIAG